VEKTVENYATNFDYTFKDFSSLKDCFQGLCKTFKNVRKKNFLCEFTGKFFFKKYD